MKVALLHDWLTGMRGGERCLEQFLDLYPDADIYTLLHVPGTTSPRIDSRVKGTSFIQKIPGARALYRHCLPLYPLAVRGFDLSSYNLVISLSHAAVKNVRITNPRALHVSYCFTPMRYIWDQAGSYFGALTPILSPILFGLRRWDKKGADAVDHFVSISKFVGARIRCFYERDATVIYPPVSTEWVSEGATPFDTLRRGEAFLYAGALVPYKRPELVVEAFNRINEELWLVGAGPEEKKLKRIAGPKIKFFGHVSDAVLASLYRKCRALVFPGIEDFGMIPVECMAAGRPVIGVYDGGLKESIIGVKPWETREEWSTLLDSGKATGVFIKPEKCDTLSALISSVYFFIAHESAFTPEACKAQASNFSSERFRSAWGNLMQELQLQGSDAKTKATAF